ncbi:MAG: YbaB/EbfC family nucleoid-associated protein [Caldilineaceae bacterium]|nr:YbaB/EbfC family nucleoid-associated protein [Caldilineaceae bacterium]
MKLKRNRPAAPRPAGGKPARGGGLGMGGNNPNQLMSQMQKLQEEMEKTQTALDDEEVTASVGGGVVTVVATGGQIIRSITIQPEAIDPDDVDMLQDMLLSAVNEALQKGKALAEERMGALTGGLGLPPGLGL